ncbi:DUF2490 domain-containing protein [Gelidibacter salicanalis]|uniref:DUF2490 domain-containing protein n=1 Tax=Gelidibacter salicanalis TaxID=291193 RepID=A0A934NK74_9FLAO|nr:DUF2490 domain-containing protein [Gelidibacter salicanalis]MBJ7882839.1 DUF2490 domain-containing protein [Gelidibacter salicanalis]
MIITKYRFLILSIMILFSVKGQSQDKFKGYFEPAIDLSYQVNPKYGLSFGVENRNVIYSDKNMQYTVKQIDLSHFSEYQWHSKYAFGLGVQYRIEHAFDVDEESELRFQEQIVYTPERSGFETDHRVRIEQRLYASVTKHRFRYQLGYTIPLAQKQANEPYLKFDTESLLEIAKTQKPELEQRLGVGLGWFVSSKTTLQFGVEYQLENYTQQLNHELFLLAELGIEL